MTTDTSWPNFEKTPIYQSFFENHDSYERYHVYLIGVRLKKDSKQKGSGSKADRKSVGIAPKTVKAGRFHIKSAVYPTCDCYAVIETFGDDTGSTDYFPVGKEKFATIKDTPLPAWDAKAVLIGKKEGTQGLRLTISDENRGADEVLFSTEIKRSDLPEAGEFGSLEEKEFVLPGEEGTRMEDVEVCLRIKISDGASRVVTKEDTEKQYENTDGISYVEKVIEDESGKPQDNALLQCWQHSSPSKAVLWVLGRNDCFMHMHVATKLFFEKGYDVYVLNYKMNGHCRKKGWVSDPHYNSHCFSGNFNVYIHDIEQSLKIIKEHHNYETTLGYAHSTGGPILVNYLMHRGDDAFDGFVFNSPFLLAHTLAEFALKNSMVARKLFNSYNDTKVGVATTPEELKDTPVTYLGTEVVVSSWSARIWSMHYFDWATRPLYKVPKTLGFAQGVTKVHINLKKVFNNKDTVTTKPFLVITARADDVLDSKGTVSRADWIGPARTEVELNDATHDIFLSNDKDDTDMAVDMVKVWMKNKGFN